MATKQLLLYGDPNGVMNADTAASANTAVMRDGSGNVAGAQVLGTELKTSGIETTAVKAVQTTAVTLDASATVWPFDTTSGSLAPPLPPAATCPGRKYTVFKTVAANTLTVTGAGSENINGANTKAITAQYGTITIVSNGTGWYITALI